MQPTEFFHQTVLLHETIQAILPSPILCDQLSQTRTVGLIIDCTLGGGGHVEYLFKELQKPPYNNILFWVIGIDRDQTAINAAQQRLAHKIPHNVRFACWKKNFAYCQELLLPETLCHLKLINDQQVSKVEEWNIPSKILGLYADFGVSSPQIDTAERGFSFLRDGELDMRMDQEESLTALDLLQQAREEELTFIFRTYAQEPKARLLARAICEARRKNKLPTTTVAFAEFIKTTLRYYQSRTPPATRIFQALRMAVNKEYESIQALLASLPTLMHAGGRSAFITFHSLEDRLVKHTMRAWERGMTQISTLEEDDDNDLHETFFPTAQHQSSTFGKENPRGGIVPSPEEKQKNPRSHSARLRVFHWL